MANIRYRPSFDCYVVGKGDKWNKGKKVCQTYEEALAIAAEFDEKFPGPGGPLRTAKEKDRICAAIHEFYQEHGIGGVRFYAREHGLNERTLARWLSDWRKKRGIETPCMKACKKVLSR